PTTAWPYETEPVQHSVAIIGVGGIFPKALNAKQYWQNVLQKVNGIIEVPKERWDPALYYDADPAAVDKTYTKIGGFVEGFKFNPLQFKIPPNVARSLDQVQQWVLTATAEAFQDAGYDQKTFDRTRCAVILGNAMGGVEIKEETTRRVYYAEAAAAFARTPEFQTLPADAQQKILQQAEAQFKGKLAPITEDSMPGELSNVIAGRVANVFNLGGKNVTTDAACAASHAAFDTAVKGLMNGEFDMVVCGGADRSMDPATYVKFCKIGALSPTGSTPFDARANGFVMGEGAGILLLKRLTDAIRDGDKVYAVIRGIGSSSDGKGKGITAPNPEGQKLAVKRALEHAALKPRYVQLVEAHGTSTKVGDVVEVESIASLFGPDTKPGTVALGSVKSQIGHLKSAAGAAGLLKAALALHHKTLPPSANFENGNPAIKWSEVPFYVNTEAKPWPAPPAGEPRRAAVSAFGFGGTNFHIIIEEYVPQYHARLLEAPAEPVVAPVHAPAPVHANEARITPQPRLPELEADVLAFAADTPDALAASVQEAIVAAKGSPEPLPRFAASRRKTKGRIRLAVAASATDQVSAQLTSVLELLADPKKRAALPMKGAFAAEGPRQGKIAFLFPGQGSQYANMLRELYRKYRVVEDTFHEADRVLEPLIGKKLTALIFVDPKDAEAVKRAEEALKQTEVTQPAMLAADVALLRLLRQWGVQPDAVAGHSLGEYAALVAAGVLSFEDALLAVSARGKEMASVKVPDFGKMASITADTATVEAILKEIDGYVVAANKNCPSQTVIAGASDAVVKAMQKCQEKGLQVIPLNVSAAFHTAIVAPASEPLGRVVARLNIQAPQVPVIANVNAEPYPTDRQAIVDMLAKQVAAPVEWQKSLERLYADGVRIFIEVGPKRALAGFVENTFEAKAKAGEVHALMLNHPKKGDLASLNEATARLIAVGVDVQLPAPTDAAAYTQAFAASIAPPAAPAPVHAHTHAHVPAERATPAPVTQGPPPAVAHATYFPSLEKDPAFKDYLQLYGSTVEQFLRASFDVYKRELAPLREKAARFERFGFCTDDLVISGASVGLPGRAHKVFGDDNFERLFRGENGIDRLTEKEERAFLDRHIVRLVKDGGEPRFEVINDIAQVLKLAARKGDFDLAKEFGIDAKLSATLDTTFKLAIAAGLDALRDAGIPLVREEVVTTTGRTLPGQWVLPKALQNETGVIFASAFPGIDNWVGELNRYFAHKYGHSAFQELMDLYGELIREIKDPAARAKVTDWFTAHAQKLKELQGPEGLYEFNRKFLFSVLSLGHAEFAELFNVRGPNTQVNAACASTTQAVAIAEDWIRTGRCRRVIVIGADDVTSDNLLPWIGSGFLASGAATTAATVAEGALPFDRRRHGMIIGMGAVGLVIEAAPETEKRGVTPVAKLIATHMVNSAYHGSRLDVNHIVGEVEKLVAKAEERLGVPRGAFAKDTVFVSHETYTPARGGSASAEVNALRKAFGDRFLDVLIANTKGFTGHPMGAGIEDALAVKCLQYGKVPPIANFREPDPDLGPLNLSQGGTHTRRYALRLAAGFGSQLALFFAEKMAHGDQRTTDPARHQAWLDQMAGRAGAKLEVVNRTLRIVEAPRAAPAPGPAPAPAATLIQPVPVV
ncbi:MAG TPA: beta-ketoacyl synthase N-terminal-like domain-containing protein, partial [Candidatus Thermoplasmatota archaeon]|nr:beta-ketoacyl synthase N-terminal-like domain-containing protein [Candidatus Thermoplasmatota archaeon]